MKMRIFLAALVAVGGLLVTAMPAHAQTFNITATPLTGGVTGDWDITLTNTGGNVYSVTAIAGSPLPDPNAYELSLDFFDSTTESPANIIDVAGGTGATVGTEGTGTWTPLSSGSSADFKETDLGPIYIAADGDNKFVGTVTLASGTPVQLVEADVHDGGVWSGTAAVPETASVLLLLAAIAPLGLMAWRRRSAPSRMV